jgi:hypothetical protein
MKKYFFISMIFLFVFNINAEISPYLTFQGRLSDTTGFYLTGTYNLTFRLYDVETGGASLWDETQSSVSITNGITNVNLGNINPLANLSFDTEYWLSVEVNSDGEMTQRIKLTSSGYSFRSKYADTASILHGNIIGSVGIGTTTPSDSLTVSGSFSADTMKIGENVLIVTSDGNVGIAGFPNQKFQIGSDTFVINDTGYIGIGTSNPQNYLQIKKSGSQEQIASFCSTTDDVSLEIRTDASVPMETYLELTHGGTDNPRKSWKIGNNDDTKLHFAYGDQNTMNSQEIMTITVEGKVGIGTTSPAEELEVSGNVYASNNVTANGNLITNSLIQVRRDDPQCFIDFFPQGGTGSEQWWLGATRDGSGIAAPGSFFIWNETDNGARMVINADGWIGINGPYDIRGLLEVRRDDGVTSFMVDAATGNVSIGDSEPGASKLKVYGTVTADAFVGDGSGLTNVPIGNAVYTLSDVEEHITTSSVFVDTYLFLVNFDDISGTSVRLTLQGKIGSAAGVNFKLLIDGTEPTGWSDLNTTSSTYTNLGSTLLTYTKPSGLASIVVQMQSVSGGTSFGQGLVITFK